MVDEISNFKDFARVCVWRGVKPGAALSRDHMYELGCAKSSRRAWRPTMIFYFDGHLTKSAAHRAVYYQIY
jgi:hypothetical protein